MAPPISKETAKTLQDTVNLVKEIAVKDKKVQARYAKMAEGLKRGIDDQSSEEVGLYRPQLAKVLVEIDDCIAAIETANILLRDLQSDATLMETKFDQIEQLVKSVSATRKRLAEQVGAGRKLVDAAEQASSRIAKGAMTAEVELSELKSSVGSLMKTIRFVDDETPKLTAAAKAAHARNDQKRLTEARVKLIEFQKYKIPAMVKKRDVEKYRKEFPDISREQKNEVQYLLDDLYRAEESVKLVEATVKELLALKPPKEAPPPPKPTPVPKAEVLKAAKACGIPDKEAPRLAKILEEPRSKWPDLLTKLARELKLKDTDGKAMAQKIEKQDFFRKQMLIDI